MSEYLSIYDEPFFITGIPLETKYGVLRPIKVIDYPKVALHLKYLEMPEWEVKEHILGRISDERLKSFISIKFNNTTLLNCIQENVANMRFYYQDLFSHFIEDYDKENFVHKFTDVSEFESFRRLVLRYNGIIVEEPNPNPQIRQFQMFKKKMNESRGSVIDFETVFTSLVVGCGMSVTEVNELTLYAFYSIFSRLQLFQQHDDTVLFKTVDAKGDIEVIDAFKCLGREDDKHYFDNVEQLKQGNVFMKPSKK